MKKIFVVLLFAGAVVLSAAELAVPFRTGLGKPGSILDAKLPWNENFTQTVTGKPVKAATRFKIAHDNKNIYIGLEAFDPDIKKAKAQKYSHDDPSLWRNDSIEINFDPEGQNALLGKIVVDINGETADYFGADDNTGEEKFTLNTAWDSNIKVLSNKRYDDRWTVELALPIGAFFDGNRTGIEKCRINIMRSCRSIGECSSFFPMPKDNYSLPRYYAPLKLEKFDPSPFRWKISGVQLSGKILNGTNTALVTTKLWHDSKRMRIIKVRASILKNSWKVIGTGTKSAGVRPGTIAEVKNFFAAPAGRCQVRVELTDAAGLLLGEQVMDAVLDFQPVRITLTEPCYRDNIYSDQKIREIVAEITVEDGIGKPMEAVLTGPGNFRAVQKIASAQPKNIVRIPFGERADGDYYLSVGKVSKRIRKLPFHKGQTRFDREGVCYVDGKPFFGFFYSGCPVEKLPAGSNTVITWGVWKDEKALIAYLDKVHKAGFHLILSPWFDQGNPQKLFDNAARRASKVSPEQLENIKRIVKITREHPAVIGYYVADEPEGANHNHNESWYEDLHRILSDMDPYHFINITNYGTEGQRRFYRGCDALRPDIYPNYFVDDSNTLPRSSSYSTSLHASMLRPSWVIIQTFDWGKKNVNGVNGRAPTYDELREQIYLAVLGNVKGLSCYTYHTWGNVTADLRVSRNYIGVELASMNDLFLRATREVKKAEKDPLFFCGMKGDADRFLVIAVNTSGKTVERTMILPGKTPSELIVTGENRKVAVKGGRLKDTFRPHEVHIYAAGNVRTDAVNHEAVRQEIIKERKGLKKPGNLLAAGEFNVCEMIDYGKGIIPAGVPKITVSSQHATHYWGRDKVATCCFLQDGFCNSGSSDMMNWTPLYTEKNPWVEIDFGKTIKAGRVVFYLAQSKYGLMLQDARILAEDGKGGWKEVGKLTDNKVRVCQVTFPSVSTRKLRIEITKRKTYDRLLDEIEVYEK